MIHETAIIDTDLNNIGEGTKIWAFSHICKNAIIGKNCVILIDDVGFANGGKGLMTNKVLKNEKYTCLDKHQQVVWVKNV